MDPLFVFDNSMIYNTNRFVMILTLRLSPGSMLLRNISRGYWLSSIAGTVVIAGSYVPRINVTGVTFMIRGYWLSSLAGTDVIAGL